MRAYWNVFRHFGCARATLRGDVVLCGIPTWFVCLLIFVLTYGAQTAKHRVAVLDGAVLQGVRLHGGWNLLQYFVCGNAKPRCYEDFFMAARWWNSLQHGIANCSQYTAISYFNKSFHLLG